MMNFDNLPIPQQERLAYAEGYVNISTLMARLIDDLERVTLELKALETAHETALERIDELELDLDGKQHDLNILGRELYRLGQ